MFHPSLLWQRSAKRLDSVAWNCSWHTNLSKHSVFEEQEPNADDDKQPDLAEVVADLLEMMRARLDGPQVCK